MDTPLSHRSDDQHDPRRAEDHLRRDLLEGRDVPDERHELVAHEERLVADTRRVGARRVRLATRVVTEEKTITVTLRREELVLQEVDERGHVTAHRPAQHATGAVRRGGQPAAEIVLHEEVVEVVKRAVPVERVRAYVDAVTVEERVTDDVRREEIHVEHLPSGTADGVQL